MRDYSVIRRNSDLWATDWAVRRRNRKIMIAAAAMVLIAAMVFLSSTLTILLTRTTFDSAGTMKSQLQGRYMCGNFEEIEIKDNTLYITYYNVNEDYDDAEFNTHTNSYLDSTYEAVITGWNYRKGELETSWTDEIWVDKSGNIVYHGRTYDKTEGPRKILRKDSDGAWGYKGDTSEELIDGTQKENNTMEENASEDVEKTKEEESLNA